MTRKISRDSGPTSCTNSLEKVHSDIVGSFSSESLGGRPRYTYKIKENGKKND